ncbi:type II toxin-antitoxin system PemK/MazF family toxin [Sediminivirga luteola]|uniref:type II toxin-antitoxin system PemK/MazF family toxin n=1 Tax=Sediminivirga luteola TaxID=1774748 RepID=UPI001F567E48|nr:type II toxin-antitoxin system PemK/MazF family toxin [Sediminivirga luteola]MCI2264207.1 type II toxin-antitoxin system PemK/MazF family toxin [Sediminivirga luteola]
MWRNLARRALRIAERSARQAWREQQRQSRRHDTSPPTPSRRTPPSRTGTVPEPGADGRPPYPGDFRGTVRPVYAPQPDGEPDPGEIVWGWVPFEEDYSRGKDRPVLVIGHDGPWLLGLLLSSRDRAPHGRFSVHEEHGQRWMNLGHGGWDSQGRESEVRLDRVVRLPESYLRREGAVLEREAFEAVTRALA